MIRKIKVVFMDFARYMRLFLPSLFAAVLMLPFASTMAASSPASNEGYTIVGQHALTFTQPARHTPNLFYLDFSGMPDGPLLGNGDVGVVVAGDPDALDFYLGKNDFWSQRTQGIMTVGQLQINTPALKGAAYTAVGDLAKAAWQGDFAQRNQGLSICAWVDANANQLFVELTNTGKESLTSSIALVNAKSLGTAAHGTMPAEVVDTPNPVLIGCEQFGGQRWFFVGQASGLKVEPRMLSEEEITVLSKSPHTVIQTFDGKTKTPLEIPVTPKTQLSISGWIKPSQLSSEANYLVSKGEWDQAYSLGLSGGRVRFTVNGAYLQTDEPVPKDQWTHVAAIFDGKGKRMGLYVNGKPAKQASDGAVTELWFLNDPDGAVKDARTVGVATRIVGTDSSSVTLSPGEKAVVVTVILSNLNTSGKDPLADAKAQVGALNPAKLPAITASHQAWWKNFWNASFIEIPDKLIERNWYSGLYVMASCSRAGKVCPGIFANWVTTNNPAWHGDYHLNYNFQAPYYGVYSANHADVALPFYEAMNQAIPVGQKIAQAHGWKGIHLPVSIGPGGITPEGPNCDWGQRSNAAYSALLYGWYFDYTQDTQWLKTSGYPYMREVAAFWTDYLKLENGRYVIRNDSIQEASGPDMNPILSLGLVRTLFKNMIVMSEALGVDADLCPLWKEMGAKLSDWPLQERNGKTVFRYAEKGTAWCDDNTLGIQHIYPAGAIGLDSDPKILEISRNMLDAMSRWIDNNGSSSWYTACARVGYQPQKALEELHKMYVGHGWPNGLLSYTTFIGGGLEDVSPPCAINEMLLQSYEGVLRFFPSWPKGMNARFGTLRAVGAFLVSAELKNDQVSGVVIFSEKGRECTVLNPWPGKKVRLTRNSQPAETLEGTRFTFKTNVGETITLALQTQ